MSRAKQLMDANVCIAISGCEDIENPGISIVEDYFKREREENRREAGLTIEINEENLPRMEREIQIWLHNKNLSELEAARVNRPMMEYPVPYEPAGVVVVPRATIQVV